MGRGLRSTNGGRTTGYLCGKKECQHLQPWRQFRNGIINLNVKSETTTFQKKTWEKAFKKLDEDKDVLR